MSNMIAHMTQKRYTKSHVYKNQQAHALADRERMRENINELAAHKSRQTSNRESKRFLLFYSVDMTRN